MLVIIRISFNTLDLFILIVLKSIHDFVCVAIGLQPDEFAPLVKKGNLINLAVFVSVSLDNIVFCPYLSRQER